MHAPKHYLAIIGLLVLHFGLLVDSAYRHSPTWDEVGHLAAGLSHWEFGRFELYSVNPPLVRTLAAAPVFFFSKPEMDWGYYRSDPTLRSEVYVGRRMMQLNGVGTRWDFFLARLAVVPISLVGGIFCFLWGSRLFGDISGCIALGLWCCSPNVLAYGSVFSPDLSSSVALVGCTYVFWRWCEDPCLGNTSLLTTALAFAMLVKSVWLALPCAMMLVLLIHRVACRFGGWRVGRQKPPFTRLLLAWGAAIFFVNAFYGFTGSLDRLDSFAFCSEAFTGGGGNRFEGGALGAVRVPLPANYLQGIDVQLRDFERGWKASGWKSYLAGEWKQGGWWYYYIAGLFLKVPLGSWALIAVGSVVGVLTSLSSWRWVGVACLWVPAFSFFAVVSGATGLNRYVRYAMPVLPVLFVWASQVGRLWERDQSFWRLKSMRSGCDSRFRRKFLKSVVVGATLWILLSMLTNAPHHLSYFNEAAGGPSNGHRLLCDSNIDWGQDLYLLEDWLRENPDAKSGLRLAYFGAFDPASIGLQFQLPSGMPPEKGEQVMGNQRMDGPLPGWSVISKNYLIGHPMPMPDGSKRMEFVRMPSGALSYFSDVEPVARVGHSMCVYFLDLDAANELRRRYDLVPIRPRSDVPSLDVNGIRKTLSAGRFETLEEEFGFE